MADISSYNNFVYKDGCDYYWEVKAFSINFTTKS